MRKILFAIALIMGVGASAQTEHMAFKGVEMTGSVSSFVSKLVADGYVKTAENGATISLSGPFAGYENCEIVVVGSAKTSTVWKVAVYLPSQSSWYTLESRYSTMKENYTKKYGTPKNDYHLFVSPYERGDGYELLAIKLDKCMYLTSWDTSLGTVYMTLYASDSKTGHVVLNYEDKVGSATNTKEKSAMANDDI